MFQVSQNTTLDEIDLEFSKISLKIIIISSNFVYIIKHSVVKQSLNLSSKKFRDIFAKFSRYFTLFIEVTLGIVRN
jgi:hypothetical protein